MPYIKTTNPKAHRVAAFFEAATAVGCLVLSGLSVMTGRDDRAFGTDTVEEHREIVRALGSVPPQRLLEDFHEAGRGDEFAVRTLERCIQNRQSETPAYSTVGECMDHMATLADGYKKRGLALIWLGALGAPAGVGWSAYGRHRRIRTGEVWINPIFMK